ncbi:MAG: GNAT family N-acetyltransferase [Lentisphaerae bacterium]|nr:GNAT family N-acetyltransferase [Lentisphaerota bacterium]MCP4102825.1 GNAT family N-acetyltransferase [Lentisphaerota bacterium]
MNSASISEFSFIIYHIDKNYWHKGFASEAAQKCLEYGFNEFNLEEIYIHM